MIWLPRSVVSVIVLLAVSACASTTDVQPPSDLEKSLREAKFFEPPSLGDASRDVDDLPVLELEHEDIRGGAMWFALDGSPEEVFEALLDFEEAAGHRSWAKEFDVLERVDDRVVARWHFEGKMGINPECVLVFEPVKLGDRRIIRYEQRETSFGLAAFFGDYQIVPVKDRPNRSILGERVFIDSGLFFVNASEEDIADGLREDARRLREWMKERSGR
ncbi:MAG: hypothetical protein RL885_06355 [Planctomycetota bacterium]